MDWTFNKYSLERKDDIKCLLIKSISETLKMDAETSKLKDFSVVNNIYIRINKIINFFVSLHNNDY